MRYESGTPYNITTGFDDNARQRHQRSAGRRRPQQRPRRRPLNIDLRLSWQKSSASRRAATRVRAGPGGGPVIIRAPGGGPAAAAAGAARGGGGGGGFGGGGFGPGANGGRVNFEMFAQVSNLTNTVNYRSYSARDDVERSSASRCRPASRAASSSACASASRLLAPAPRGAGALSDGTSCTAPHTRAGSRATARDPAFACPGLDFAGRPQHSACRRPGGCP